MTILVKFMVYPFFYIEAKVPSLDEKKNKSSLNEMHFHESVITLIY